MTKLHDALASVNHRLRRLIQNGDLAEGIAPETLRECVRAYPERPGKAMRPALLLWSCGLLGGNPEQAEPAALAVELYHDWTLVHDDIIDRDPTRRGGPACHLLAQKRAPGKLRDAPESAAHYGLTMALLAGDLLQARAVAALLHCRTTGVSAPVVLALAERMTRWLTPALVSGEALDSELAAQSQPDRAQIETMLRLKTGALLRFCAETGAVIAAGTPDYGLPEIRRIGDFAELIGLAFQLRDDLLGVFGQAGQTGKPVGSDAREGKKTLLIIEALQRAAPPVAARIRSLWGRPNLTPGELGELQGLLRRCGAEDAIESRIQTIFNQARNALQHFPENPYRALLDKWAQFAVHRRR